MSFLDGEIGGRIFGENMRERKEGESKRERGDKAGSHPLHSQHVMVPLDLHMRAERSG